jgi:hypothetical protein
MRGELIGVWPETWQGVWLPLTDNEDVQPDIFCELYRELSDSSLGDPTGDEAVQRVIDDAILLREAFEQALSSATTEITLSQADAAFEASGATSLNGALERRAAVETALTVLVRDSAMSGELLGQALLEIANNPKKRAEARERAIDRIVNDPIKSRDAFERVRPNDFGGERALVTFLEATHSALDDLYGDDLSNRYFNLLEAFINKFSLRYDLRRPCTLCPTLPGMFASLVRDLRALTSQDVHLESMMKDFENAIRDLRFDCSDGRIRTCIQKQVNLLEAVGGKFPGVTESELSGICNQVGTWPHKAIQASLKNLYGFTSDYPGIRHGTNAAGAIRTIEMRDMVAMCILLTGFTPYLTDQLDADVIYRGS